MTSSASLLIVCLTATLIAIVVGQFQPDRMSSPLGLPDMDGLDRGADFGPQGRSGAGTAAGNSISNLYNNYQMPMVQPNSVGMSKFYSPSLFAPPMNLRGPPMPFSGPPPQQRQDAPRPNDGSIQVEDLFCNQLRSVVGMSNDRNHWLSTVECECRLQNSRQPEYACYSLCDAPRYGSRCEASFSILNSCPSYKNCGNWTQSNTTDSGAISCTPGVPVPESVCWILASTQLREDDTPLRPAFYANAAGGCFMSCLCGNDGTIAGEIQCLKTPTSRWKFPVYPRSKKFDFNQNG